MKYPNGVLIEFDGSVYRVSNNDLILLISWPAVLSWGQPVLVAQNPDLLDEYTIAGARLGFRPTSVVKSVDSGTHYYIDGVQRREVVSDAFWELGFEPFETVEATEEEIMFHPEGEPIG